ncbi:MAG: hypothetical protein KBD16_01360 [Candidatus Pacebacteria bacterium]|nr:hypothetical protein [Candidatus Paceibacterota bacterium]
MSAQPDLKYLTDRVADLSAANQRANDQNREEYLLRRKFEEKSLWKGWVIVALMAILLVGGCNLWIKDGRLDAYEQAAAEQRAIQEKEINRPIEVGEVQVVDRELSVTVSNPESISSYRWDDNCTVKAGGTMTVVALMPKEQWGQRWLARYERASQTENAGNVCPSGTIFISTMEPQYFREMTSLYEKGIQETKEKQEQIRGLLNPAK